MPRARKRRDPTKLMSPVGGVNELETLRAAQHSDYVPMFIDAGNVMPWLDGPPTEPGYYWSAWKVGAGSFQLERVRPENGELICRRSEGDARVKYMERRWCGPLPLPDGWPI